MVEIVEVASPTGMDEVRVLFGEYKKAVGVDLWFGVDFQRELDELPEPYVAPAGRLVIARDGDQLAGCGASGHSAPGSSSCGVSGSASHTGSRASAS